MTHYTINRSELIRSSARVICSVSLLDCSVTNRQDYEEHNGPGRNGSNDGAN